MKIFISYRHSDPIAATAQLIHDGLIEHCQSADVFLDSDYLKVSDTFPAVLESHLASCDVFVVLIDKVWISSMNRLKDPEDWVRHEIEVALARMRSDHARVIPVLMYGAKMPAKERLPPSLAELTTLHRPEPLRGSLQPYIASLALHIDGWTPDQLLKWLRSRRRAAGVIAAGVVMLFTASMLSLFDKLTIDTQIEALTMAMADAIDRQPLDERIVLVTIGAEDVKRFGPLGKGWRGQHAGLIRKLSAEGVSVVAFDMFLADTSPDDKALVAAATAARANGTTVIFGSNSGQPPFPMPPGSIEFGLLCIGTELDWARVAPVASSRQAVVDPKSADKSQPKTQYFASLAARAAVAGAPIREFDIPNRQVFFDNPAGGSLKIRYSRTQRLSTDQACTALVKDDRVAQRIIRFTRLDLLREPSRRLAYHDVIDMPAGSGASRFKDKIVLVGAESDKDKKFVNRAFSTEERQGFEIQADVINTLLQEQDIRALAPLPQFLLTLAMGVLGMVGRFSPRLWTLRRRVAFLVVVPLAYLGFGAWLCAEGDVLLNTAYQIGAFLFAFWISGVVLHHKGLWDTSRH